MKVFDIVLPSCEQHKPLEDTEQGEGLQAHYVLPDGQCHCLVTEKQIEYLDKLEIQSHKHPVDAKASFCKQGSPGVPRHTFGSKVRDKKVLDAKELADKQAKAKLKPEQ